jgi:hypothetical protein
MISQQIHYSCQYNTLSIRYYLGIS